MSFRFQPSNRARHCTLAASALLLLSSATALHALKTCNAVKYGALPDGKTKNTLALQKAIDACEGGGMVELAGGVFVSGPIVLKSGVTLHLADGTTLLGSPDHADYPKKTEFRAPGIQSLISATNADHVAITGKGTIDGNGQSWWTEFRAARSTQPKAETHAFEVAHPRPRLVVFDHCTHVTMEGVTVKDSPFWQIVPYYSKYLTFKNMRVLAPANSPNSDAIDPFSSQHIVIDHVFTDVGDDNIAIKSGQPGSDGGDEPSSDITITDCVFLHGHGLSIGSEIAGGVQNVHAERIRFEDTDQGIRVKSNRDRGNDIGDFFFRDIEMKNVTTAILISEYYPKVPEGVDPRQPVTRLTPRFHDITIENVTATGSKVAGIVVGLPEMPVKNVVLRNVTISAETGMTLSNAEVHMENVKITPHSGPAILKLSGVTGSTK